LLTVDFLTRDRLLEARRFLTSAMFMCNFYFVIGAAATLI
jgi:hypothetical protein